MSYGIFMVLLFERRGKPNISIAVCSTCSSAGIGGLCELPLC